MPGKSAFLRPIKAIQKSTVNSMVKPTVTTRVTKQYPNGSTYVGSVNAVGQRHGIGQLSNSDGSKIYGTFAHNMLQDGYMVYESNTYCFTGEVTNGTRNGHGTEVHTSGIQYEGNFHDNQRSGHGKSVSACGSHEYIGEWLRDKAHGAGVHIAPNSVYNGEFVAGNRQGKGVETYVSRGFTYKYEGQYHHNMRHGLGTFTVNGVTFSDEFRNDDAVHHNLLLLAYCEQRERPNLVGYANPL